MALKKVGESGRYGLNAEMLSFPGTFHFVFCITTLRRYSHTM